MTDARVKTVARKLYTEVRGVDEAQVIDPRARMLLLLDRWVRCRPHQPVLRALIELAIVNCQIEMSARRMTRPVAGASR